MQPSAAGWYSKLSYGVLEIYVDDRANHCVLSRAYEKLKGAGPLQWA